ncbi:MAG TPA: mechanosensitive ion channel family protein [Burkholderiales bacterium]|nr:mechanosensitive ion channel family protein [Burkholderiales bacterium]
MNNQLATLQQIQSTVIDLAIKFGPKLFVAILILAAGFVAASWTAKIMLRGLNKFELEPPVRDLLVRIVQILVLGLFVIMALQNLGVELLPLVAGIGLAGAGLALAMQGVLANLVAGLTIIFTRPFRVGEYVSLLGEEGSVESISLFSTVLNHPDLSRVIIPNRKIVGEIFRNYGKIRQLDISVAVAYDTDLNKALSTLSGILQENPRVLKDPAPLIGVNVLAQSAIIIAVKPWVNVSNFGTSRNEISKAIVETFRGCAITIPLPQRQVRLLGSAA